MKNAVFYFSGTGNSLAVAKKICEKLNDCSLFDITNEFLSEQDCNAIFNENPCFERLVVVFPSYAYGMPKIVKQFLSNFSICAEYVALIVTCGTKSGGTIHSAARKLSKRKIKVDYHAEIQTVENFIPIFGNTKPHKIKFRLENQIEKSDEIVDEIERKIKKSLKGKKIISAAISSLFLLSSPLLSRFMAFNNKCFGCGLCQKCCPAKAITINGTKKPKIIFRKCNLCQCCINICPAKAITFFRHGKKTEKYICPHIEQSELLRR
jgi:ferredoxin